MITRTCERKVGRKNFENLKMIDCACLLIIPHVGKGISRHRLALNFLSSSYSNSKREKIYHRDTLERYFHVLSKKCTAQ